MHTQNVNNLENYAFTHTMQMLNEFVYDTPIQFTNIVQTYTIIYGTFGTNLYLFYCPTVFDGQWRGRQCVQSLLKVKALHVALRQCGRIHAIHACFVFTGALRLWCT